MGLEQELIEDLTAKLQKNDPMFDPDLLRVNVKVAIRGLRNKRMYKNNPNYYNTEEKIEEDMENYYDILFRVIDKWYSDEGMAGQLRHSEGGISMTFEPSSSDFAGVVPICQLVK